MADPVDAPPPWMKSPEQLRIGMEMAELGQMKVRHGEALAEGSVKDHNGIPLAGFTSAAETGWVHCVRHGLMHSVGPTGSWERAGVCEGCFRADHSPSTLARRAREAAVIAATKAEAAEVAARQAREESEAAMGAARRLDEGATPPLEPPLPNHPMAHGAGEVLAHPPGAGPVEMRVDGIEGMGPSAGDGPPAIRPPDSRGDLAGQWLRLTEVD